LRACYPSPKSRKIGNPGFDHLHVKKETARLIDALRQRLNSGLINFAAANKPIQTKLSKFGQRPRAARQPSILRCGPEFRFSCDARV
jgi:hypothetical protein